MLQDIVAVQCLDNYKLYLTFEDHTTGIVNISELVEFSGVFAPLSQFAYFAQVKVNPDLGTIGWPNGADLDPDVLYCLVTQQPVQVSGPRP